MSRRDRLTLLGLAVALTVLTLDQASKWWILHRLDLPALGSIALLPVLNLTMVWNHGVTFGLLTTHGPAGPYLLGTVALAVVVALGVWLRRAGHALIAVPIGAVAGGAVGNVVDRLRYGAVVDFIHAHAFGYSWYVFNVADAAIVCGVTALMLESVLRSGNDKPRAALPADPARTSRDP